VEELEVQKRPVETGKVRITKVGHERETLVDEPLLHDEVAITRVPMQRVMDGPVPVRKENGTTIISISAVTSGRHGGANALTALVR